MATTALAAGLAPTVGGVAAQAAPATGDGGAASPVVATRPAAAATRARSQTALVDAVKAPTLHWYRCYGDAQCTTAKVPLDYDQPKGAQVELALLRRPARDRKHRIGSLFVNPGGPGGQATELAYFSDQILSPKVLDRFDVVGMDPRGIGFSDTVACLTPATQPAAMAGYAGAFPYGAQQEKAWIASDRAVGRACSRTTLARSMSTAEVARDMELMRRAVGDKKLTYLGFSYGTYLGQVYANMFPKRFRAVAVDGVLDPVAWAGDAKNAGQPLEARLNSGGGAWKALREILRRCDRVGGARCAFAAGDPEANLKVIADRLRAHPLEVTDDFGDSYSLTYADLVGLMLGDLYDPAGYDDIVANLAALWVLTEPPNPAARTSAARRATLERAHATLAASVATLRADEHAGRPAWGPRGFPYDSSFDGFASVTCTDSTETTTSAQYPGFAVAAERRAPYFGRAWLWGSSICAGDAFTGQDEDAYTGPFDRRTKARVLYVGNDWDPATSYAGAVSASRRQPGARLLRSKSWGHTAYGTSGCVTRAVDAYLLKATLPRKGKVCTGDVQPFESDPSELKVSARRQAALSQRLTGPFPTR